MAPARPTGPDRLYFEDVVVGDERVSRRYALTSDDISSFAAQWDPLPSHLSDDGARAAGFPGQTASGTHLLAIKHKLLYDFGFEHTVVASFGFDEVRFRAPGVPGDALSVRLRWVERRRSNSRPDTGIARHYCELSREDGAVLLSLYDTILIRSRCA